MDGEVFANKLDFSLPCLLERQKTAKKNDIVDGFEHIWRGGIVCMCEEVIPIDQKNCFIPCNLI